MVTVILEDKEENETNKKEKNTNYCWRDWNIDQLGLCMCMYVCVCVCVCVSECVIKTID